MKILIKIGILILISFFLLPCISHAAVVINEVAWMGTENSASDEWIELYSDQEVDLSDWLLEATDGSPSILLEGFIPANGYFLLERTDDDSVPSIAASQIYSGALSNTGEHLILKDDSGNTVDEVNHAEGWPAGNNSTKQTMERIDNAWQTSSEPSGTPKMPNSSGEILSNNQPAVKNLVPENLNPSEDQPPIAKAGNNLIAFIDEEIIFDGSQSYDPDGKDLAYEWNLGEGGVLDDIIVKHKYFYPGTYLVTLMVFDGRHYGKETITVNIYSKNITINEFLPDPLGKDSGDEENLGEWVELYNNSDQIIDISAWQLDDEEGGSKPFIFPVNTLIRPKGYLILPRQITKIALNNDKDSVRLLLSTGIVFQEISYENAPEGESSAQTSEGFVWSMPTPGLPNIIISENNFSSSNFSFQSQITKQPSEKIRDTTLYPTSTFNGAIDDDWIQKESSSYYNLANLRKATSKDSKLFLIVLVLLVIFSLIGIGILKFKKKL